MRLLTSEQMREADRRTIEDIGIPGVVLMENAGRALADALCRRYEQLRPGPVLVLCGKGNNGGDGYVVARHLQERGWRTQTVVLADREKITGDAAVFLQALINSRAPVEFVGNGEWRDAADREEPAVLVDAMLGTGLSSDVRGVYADVTDWMNEHPAPVAAVDIPSGIDASSGRVLGRAVRADLTVSFAFAKLGHAGYPGVDYVGELQVADIGIPPQAARSEGGEHLLLEAPEAARMLPRRPGAGHKGSFGHVLVVAGASGTSGAAAMTARGAQRSGSGLVSVGCPRAIHDILEVKLTEAMTAPLSDLEGTLCLVAFDEILELVRGKQVLALGPGLGTRDETVQLVRRLVRSCDVPMVIDADGLNALAGHPDCLKERREATTILTPHPGEMARLTGSSVTDIEADRLNAARDFATEHGVVVLLKGARTVVAGPKGDVRINSAGNSGLASGGMGDVLTGLIAGLLGQGLCGLDAAALGSYLHGLAADNLAARRGEAGMTAGDLLRELPAARLSLNLKEI